MSFSNLRLDFIFCYLFEKAFVECLCNLFLCGSAPTPPAERLYVVYIKPVLICVPVSRYLFRAIAYGKFDMSRPVNLSGFHPEPRHFLKKVGKNFHISALCAENIQGQGTKVPCGGVGVKPPQAICNRPATCFVVWWLPSLAERSRCYTMQTDIFTGRVAGINQKQ
jgi:hypothetical protein